MRGEVALLTRNIKIRGEMASDYCPVSNGNCKEYDYDTFGGHIKVCLAKCMFTIRSFPHSQIITWFLTRVTRRAPHVEQELRTLLQHMRLPLFEWVCVAGSLVVCVMFCRSLFVLLFFFFCHCGGCSSSGYSFGIFKHFLIFMQ